MNKSTIEPILVIGASGKTGRRVASRLQQMGHNIRPVSRRSSIPFDWENPETWPTALSGVSAAYVAYTPDLAVPSAHGVIAQFVTACEQAGLQRIVLLSERNEARAQACEALVTSSKMAWTILRPSWFMQNFNEGGFLEAVLAGTVSVPDSGAAEPFVDLEDVADVAVAALTSKDHAGKVYEITGPDLLTWDEAVSHIAKVTGRDVQFARCSPEDFERTLVSVGVPESDAAFTANLVAEILDGKNATLGTGLQQALDREPRSFAEFCREAHAAGDWN